MKIKILLSIVAAAAVTLAVGQTSQISNLKHNCAGTVPINSLGVSKHGHNIVRTTNDVIRLDGVVVHEGCNK